ncbi:type II toxin-antitoxin system death-on-curing family toxin [Wenyingzhuangia aestuarii]|uniref:type II toxin-antitoxin system death-on-curing family toxin n=1 Tax=Wenyingzhuangia aestuarii TaxID=1647582 RepID=UPI00143B6F0C|nr:type II toxin-antitoxin system death-on-curing family toxin [Wenyingzhuangia aestuarii]NJB82124.1 death-on-curing protein [Wenyingzhuangia aestuarii]
MKIKFQYFTTTYAIQVHDNIIKESGGLMGIKDTGLIDSTLYHIQHELYYPDIEHKLTHILFSFNKNHCFNDGNKRASLALSVYFLAINDLDFLIDKFIIKMENIVVDVADNRINKELLFDIISSILYEDDYSESLKLKIINAKINGEPI